MKSPVLESIPSKSIIAENDNYQIVTPLFSLTGQVVQLGEKEMLIKPFSFTKTKTIRYFDGTEEVFDREVIISRSQIVMMKLWEPA